MRALILTFCLAFAMADQGMDPSVKWDCCRNLVFRSSGSLQDSEQNHVLGPYSYLQTGPADFWYYKQTTGAGRKLWHNFDINVKSHYDTI